MNMKRKKMLVDKKLWISWLHGSNFIVHVLLSQKREYNFLISTLYKNRFMLTDKETRSIIISPWWLCDVIADRSVRWASTQYGRGVYLQNRCVFVCDLQDDNQEAKMVNVQECVWMCVFRLIQHSGRSVKNPSRLETGSKLPAAAANPHEAFWFGYSNQSGSSLSSTGTNLSERTKRILNL